MTTFHENIRSVLSEIDKFIDSLKGEKLSKKVQANKDKVIELIKKLREEWPALENPSQSTELKVPPTNDRDVSNESIQTKSSHGSGNAEDDDTAYGDNVPEKAVKDLTNAVKAGYLDKKRKKATLLQSAFQKRYCVIQDRIFYYYEKNKDVKQAGAFYLEGYEFREAPQIVKDASKKDLCFELVAPGKRSYQFSAESKEEFQAWRNAITGSGISSGSAEDFVIEGELEDIYEEMDEVAERAKALGASQPSNKDETFDQEVYDDAQTAEPGEPEEIYDDVDNVDRSKPTSEVKSLPDVLPPPLPPPMNKTPSKPSMPLPAVPPPAPPSVPPPAPPAVPPPAPPAEVPPEVPPPRPTAAKTPTRPKIQITVNPDEDYDNMYYGKWDCHGDSEEELSFRHGDMIHIISREFDNKDWWVGRLNEKYGLVPKNYLIRAYKAV